MESQKIQWKGYLILIDLSILFCLIDSGITKAQITPDNTLPNNSVVNPLGEVQRITGGSQSERNLFHSFDEFSVPTGGTAYFDNAINVENIISRITGKSVSNIDGLIQANGTANVFLLNPNGIIFGPNSRLNIGGSFIGSTASSVNFADGTSFSATNPQSQPLLKVSRPIGLSFESNLGTIKVEGNGHELIRQSIDSGGSSPVLGINSSAGLEVESGKTLALIGNNLILEGGILTSRGGRIELGSVEDRAAVGLTPTPFGGWALEYDDSSELGNIQLAQRSFVGVYGTDGGTIRLRGANVSLNDASMILNQNQGSQPSGELSVNASESLQINGISEEARLRSGLFSEATGMGRGGNLLYQPIGCYLRMVQEFVV